MGSEEDNILASFSFDNEEDVVLVKFEEYFIPKRNHEHASIRETSYPGEKAEMYIRSLYELTANCELGAKRDEHICDRLVVGMRDKIFPRSYN